MTRKIAPADLEHAVGEYLAGESVENVARRWHTSEKTLKDELAGRGLLRSERDISRIRSQRLTDRWAGKDVLPADEIVRRYLSGESQKTLADNFGVSRYAIRRRLELAGVDIRDIGNANQLMMSTRGADKHKRNTAAANAAARGRVTTFEERCKSALGRERSQSFVSHYERQLAAWLLERGAHPVTQKAIGPYNLDIALAPVAVEVFGGGWHAYGDHATRSAERFQYILDNGWSVVIIWVNRRAGGLTVKAADYVIAHLERARRDPSLIGQYGVIRGDGQEVAAFSRNLDNLTRIPTLGGRLD